MAGAALGGKTEIPRVCGNVTHPGQRTCQDKVCLIPKAGGDGSQSLFGPGAEVPVVQAGNGGHWRMMLFIQGLTWDGSPARDQDAEAPWGM